MSEEESINAELNAEILELRKLLKDKNNKVSIESLSSFYISEELADKLKISGVLIAEGLWNGVKYSWNELKKMYKKYKNKLSKLSLKVEHERDEEFKSKNIGKHIKVDLNETLKAILYEAEITDKEAIKDVKEGKFRATSLKSEMYKVISNGEALGKDIVPIDNSLTAYPACDRCQLYSWEELSKDSKGIEYFGVVEEDLNKKKITSDIDDVNMTDYIELKEGEVLVLPADLEELSSEFEDIAFEVMPREDAIKQHRRIFRDTLGKYTKSLKRKKGYYYYLGEDIPLPFYLFYYNPEDYTETQSPDMSELSIEHIIMELSNYKLVHNKDKKSWTALKVVDEGIWKVEETFEDETKAKDFMKGLNKEKKKEKQVEEDRQIKYWHMRVKDPDYFDPTSFRVITLKGNIKATIGCKKGNFSGGKCQIGTEVQKYLLPKDKYSEAQAKAWIKKYRERKKLSKENIKEGDIEIMSEEGKTEEVKTEPVKEEVKTEEKKEEIKTEEVKEEKKEEPKVEEKVEEKKEEPKVEVKKEEPKVEEKKEEEVIEEPVRTFRDIVGTMKEEKMFTPEVAADILIRREKRPKEEKY